MTNPEIKNSKKDSETIDNVVAKALHCQCGVVYVEKLTYNQKGMLSTYIYIGAVNASPPASKIWIAHLDRVG